MTDQSGVDPNAATPQTGADPAAATATGAESAAAEGDDPSLIGTGGQPKTEGGGEAKTDGEEPKGEAPEPFNPETLTFPEGFEKNDEMIGSFANLAKEHNLSQATAQSLIDLHVGELKRLGEAPMQAWKNLNKEWADEVKADPEIGGDNLHGVQQTIGRALDTFGTPELRQALDYTGAGNNPHVVRAFYKMAKALEEGGQVTGEPAAMSKPTSLAKAMYPDLPE